jgi:penicillin-binding protein 1A
MAIRLSSVVLDAPIEIVSRWPGCRCGAQELRRRFYGPSTLRLGIERSRNVMTVRLAQDMGMPLVAEYSEALRCL